MHIYKKKEKKIIKRTKLGGLTVLAQILRLTQSIVPQFKVAYEKLGSQKCVGKDLEKHYHKITQKFKQTRK